MTRRGRPPRRAGIKRSPSSTSWAPTMKRRTSAGSSPPLPRNATPKRGLTLLRDRLGLPEMRAARPFAAAMLIDALGSGLFLPFSLLYFHHAGGLPLLEAGFGLSVAMLIALPAPLVGGVLIDRVGPKHVITATNGASAVGFAAYLLVHNLAALIAVALLVALSDRLFWAAQPALVAEISPSGARDRWFGLTAAVRCAGLGAGGLLAGIAVTRDSGGAYHVLAVTNAASFALCATLIAGLRVPDCDSPLATEPPS